MDNFRAGIILFVLLLLKCTVIADVQTLVVMPFSNLSKTPGCQWVGESFPELLQDRLIWPNLNPLGREERLIAFDRIGIAYSNQLSKASLIKIGQELDSNYLILGDFTCDGQRLQASASVLDMHRNYLGPPIQEQGALSDLQLICGRIAWQIVNSLDPHVSVSAEAFLKRFPVIPSEALENYIRGLMESDLNKQVRYFREADKNYPNYSEAIFQLGKIYYQQKDYPTSCLWLQRLTRMNRNYLAASFLLGLNYLNLNNYEKATAEFQQLIQILPLNSVYTNLGIALSYQGLNDKATKAFELALDGDPSGIDSYFNLAYHLWKLGDFSKAVQNLKVLTQKSDQDGQAYYLLYKCQQALGKVAEAEAAWALAKQLKPEVEVWENHKRVPDLFRVQNRFDETTFRLLRMEIDQQQNNKTAHLPVNQESQGNLTPNP